MAKRDIFVQMLEEICEETWYTYAKFSQDWIIQLHYGSQYAFVYGYSFSCNADASAKICVDKSATYDVLSAKGIPCVEHILFHTYGGSYSQGSHWEKMQQFFHTHNQHIVIKPNKWTGGTQVQQVRSLSELESTVYQQFSQTNMIAFSPFYTIQKEVRIVMYNGTPEIIFSKEIPHIVGNGKDTVSNLLSQYFDNEIPKPVLEFLVEERISMQSILSKGDCLPLQWKHNLSAGACAIDCAAETFPQAITIAKQTMKALDMSFVSVDLVLLNNGDWKVLEVNSGVMLVNFASQSYANYQKAKEVYKKVLQDIFISS